MLTSLRLWLISSFSAILLICLVAIGLFIKSNKKSKDLENYHSNLKTTGILLFEINKLKEDILIGDFKETGFYTSNFSLPEQKFRVLNEKILLSINSLLDSKITENYKLSWKIELIKKQAYRFNKIYNELIYLYKLKGFKDYGLEGKMREYAHHLYDFDDKEVKFLCLVLRKHEKDFLLRKDLAYVHQFDFVSKSLIEYINESKTISGKDKSFLINNVYYYIKYFKMLARIESKMGIKGRNGYLDRSKQVFDNIVFLIDNIDNELKLIKTEHKEKLAKDTVVVIVVLVTFLLTTIIVLTQLITRSVKNISFSFTKYVNSGFNIDSVNYQRSKIKEFNDIFISFLKMAKEINIFTNFFREKVLERTLAINQQKDEILAQQLKIENQYKTLLSKNGELKEQKQLLAIKNNDVKESLRYAKRIQKALQPKASKFKESFKDSFIYSKAKDVVSGDFYLVYKTDKSQRFSENKSVFIVSDCTGHGVPGAIMSVLGINILYKVVREHKNSEPGNILTLLDKDLNQALAHGKNGSDIVADGMDIGVFSFNHDTYMLDYSIAKFSHFMVRDSTIVQLDTLRSSIGYSFFENESKNFNTSTVQLKRGDCLYLFSDGLQDQFGGPFNKKYKKNNIKELIYRIHHLPMRDQKEKFKSEFTSWKSDQAQTDDVLVIGIRF